MAPPRRQATRGRARRRVRKNIAIGQAHIKTSFNNTIVSLTDNEGNVIAWESAGSAGFKGSRKSTPFAAQVTADACARKGMEHGLQKVEVFVGAFLPRPTVFFGPLRVRAFVFVRWLFTGRPRR